MTDEHLALPTTDALETDLLSPRLQFYLRHKTDIETWAALKNEVRDATSDLLLGVREDLDALAPDLGSDVGVRVDGHGTSWPRLVLRRESWPVEEGEAVVGVALEWTRQVNPSGKEPPYVGIRVNKNANGGKDLMELLRQLVKASGAFTPGYITGLYWPAYRYVEREPDWWMDLDGWRARMLEQLLGCWRQSVPLIDAAMTQVNTSDIEA